VRLTNETDELENRERLLLRHGCHARLERVALLANLSQLKNKSPGVLIEINDNEWD
jgi:hypothetical protein